MPRRRQRKNKSVAHRALRLARKAYNASDHEIKVVESFFNDFGITQASTFVPQLINGLTEGVSQNNRIGERASMLRLQLRLEFRKNPANADAASSVRFLVVWDKQNNGGTFTPPNLLENTDVGGGANVTANMYSMYNAQQRTRFQVLLDRTLILNDGANEFRAVKWSVPLHRRQVQYNGANGNAAAIITGGLFVCVFGGVTDGGNQSTVSGQMRLWFVD